MSSEEKGKRDYTADDMFMGSEVVYFKIADGVVYNYSKDAFSECEGADKVAEAKRRFEPVAYLGDDYRHMVVPAIPATDIQCSPDSKVWLTKPQHVVGSFLWEGTLYSDFLLLQFTGLIPPPPR